MQATLHRRRHVPFTIPCVALVLAGAAAALPGCSVLGGARAEAPEPGPGYPVAAERGEQADVQVFRDNTRLRLTNTTTADFGPGTLWINQQFSRPLDGFAPGQSLDLDLFSFVDEFSERFRGGGFFATRDPEKVVLVEFQPEGEDTLVGFVVVRNRMN